MIKKKVTFILGTRPEAIKLAPLIKVFQSSGIFDTRVVLTGQHEDMVNNVFELFDIKADINLKLMAAIRVSRLVVPHMKEKNKGSIINAAIGGGKAPNAMSLPTSVTRAAGINLTKSLANEYAKYNVRVNAICIGLIKSAQWERKAIDGDIQNLYEELSKKVPMGKVGEEIDYANLVAFLASDRSGYITGTAINLDGGMCPVV